LKIRGRFFSKIFLKEKRNWKNGNVRHVATYMTLKKGTLSTVFPPEQPLNPYPKIGSVLSVEWARSFSKKSPECP